MPAPKAIVRYPRVGRLLRRAEFERVYKQGRRHFSSHMTFFYWPRVVPGTGAEQAYSGMRIGFTVSRALGGAVERNRMKRRLRESARSCWFANSPSVDVVVNPKKSLLTAEFSGLQQEMRRAFEVIAQKLAAKPSSRS